MRDSQSSLPELARLIQQRNAIDDEITKIVSRPALIGHLGEFIASRIFSIALYPLATHLDSDGVFTEGALAGKSVNVKWHPKRENVLDLKPTCACHIIWY